MSGNNPSLNLVSRQVILVNYGKMAEIQNGYYIDKVKTIRNNLQGHNSDPLAVLKKTLNGNQSSFSSQAISPDEVDKIIRELKNSKACGMDNLDTYIIKLTRQAIVPSVCHIINLSLQSNKFPTKWKIAKVVPLYKGKGSKLDPCCTGQLCYGSLIIQKTSWG